MKIRNLGGAEINMLRIKFFQEITSDFATMLLIRNKKVNIHMRVKLFEDIDHILRIGVKNISDLTEDKLRSILEIDK